MRNTVAKKQAGQKDVDSNYLFIEAIARPRVGSELPDITRISLAQSGLWRVRSGAQRVYLSHFTQILRHAQHCETLIIEFTFDTSNLIEIQEAIEKLAPGERAELWDWFQAQEIEETDECLRPLMKEFVLSKHKAELLRKRFGS